MGLFDPRRVALPLVLDPRAEYIAGRMAPKNKLVRQYGMTAAVRAERKTFLGLTGEDETRLGDLRAFFSKDSDRLIDEFYEHLLSFDHAREMLTAEPGRLERLRKIQQRHFLRLLEGKFDEDYFEERLRVGTTHERVGLSPQWYLGAYNLYLQLALPALARIHRDDAARCVETAQSLIKVVFLDLGLALDTYIQANTSALEDSRSYLQSIFQSMSDPLSVISTDGRLIDCNPAFERLSHYQKAQVVGMPAQAIFGEPDDHELRLRIRHIEQEGSIHDDRLLFPREGEPIPIAFSGSAIRDYRGQVQGYVGTMRDLRERHRLTSALEESRSYFERVLSSISDGLIVVTVDGRIQDVNPELLNMSGYLRSELLGQSLTTLWREETDAQLRQRLERTAAEESWHDDRNLYSKDGPAIPVAFSGAPIRDPQGALLGFVGVARDMGERNRLLADLEQAKTTLEVRVEQRTNELRKAQAQLLQSEKLSAIGQLAAGVAHEIGTPLNVISGRAEYLLAELGSDDPRGQNLQVIIAQIDRISGLIQQLLDFARDRGDAMGPVNLRRAVDALLPLLEGRMRKLGIAFHADLAHLPDIYGNPNRIQQILLNLILNAVDAISEARPYGPGQIIFDGEVQADSDTVLLRFNDDGCGISGDDLVKVFDPFFTTKPVGQGTGLGLSVTYGLVQDMGGSIWVETEPGAGTTFLIRLRRAGPIPTRG